MNGTKRYFCYEVKHGRPSPVLFYDLPTDGAGVSKLKDYWQMLEVPTEHYNLGVTQLSLIYPYKEVEKQDEKFKI